MRIIVLFISLVFLSSHSFAQDEDLSIPNITFGLKVGINSVQMKVASQSSENTQNKSGVYFGAFVNIPSSDAFSIQPEIIYSSTEYSGSNKMNFLNVPVLLTFKLSNNFTGFFGPEAQILLDIDARENKDLFNSFLLGFTFGANYKVTPNFYLEARPYFAFTKFLEDDLGYRKFNTLQIGIAYKF